MCIICIYYIYVARTVYFINLYCNWFIFHRMIFFQTHRAAERKLDAMVNVFFSSKASLCLIVINEIPTLSTEQRKTCGRISARSPSWLQGESGFALKGAGGVYISHITLFWLDLTSLSPPVGNNTVTICHHFKTKACSNSAYGKKLPWCFLFWFLRLARSTLAGILPSQAPTPLSFTELCHVPQYGLRRWGKPMVAIVFFHGILKDWHMES